VRPDGSAIADDVVLLPLQAGTQWDSLAHVSFEGRLYGGRPASEVSLQGAGPTSIDRVSARFASRGVLVDLPRHLGVDALEPEHAIGARELDDALAATGTSLGSGDVLLVRTGYLAACRARDWEGLHDTSPGLGLDTLEWIHERQLAAVASDTVSVEVRPSRVPGFVVPFHVVALVYMGLMLGELFDLEALAADCAGDGVHEFLFVAPPLRVTGAVGSPVNPYAVK
jgi:kynurenine formamidase